MKTNEETKEMTIAQAKFTLKQAGYFVDNLWHVDDVKPVHDCDDDMAQKILYLALTNENTIEQIQYAIKVASEIYKLERNK